MPTRDASGRFVTWQDDDEAERFWSYVDKDGPVVREELGQCYVWTGSTRGGGYGRFSRKGTNEPVASHRYAWELQNGEVPEDMMVLHKCDNRACVRVDHLYVGTGSDNNRDAFERGRRANLKGADHPQSVVDLELLEVILALRAAGATYRYIATGLGMSVSTVWKAVNNPVPVSEEDA